MPIILDQSVQNALQATSLADVIKPTYFSDTLTGNGSGSRGLLNENMNPVNINGDLTTYLQLMSANKMTDKNGSVKTEHIPLEIIDRAETPHVTKRLNKDRENMVKIGTFTGKDTELYLSVRPVNIFHETIEKDDVKSKKTVVAYDILVWCVTKNLKSEIYGIKPNLHSLADGTIIIIKTVNLKKDLEKIADTLSVMPSLKFDVNALDRYLSDFNLYDEIVRQAKRWIYDVADEIDAIFHEIKNANYDDRKLRLILTRILKRLETYKVELNQYIKIQASLEKHFRKDIVDRVSKANLQILLANTLGKIEQQKHHIVCFTNDTNIQIDPKFSVEQREIITCEEPLIIAQATAGSGKSTTLNARVNHMLKCGVEAKDITVLSFSNAAADHIKELNEEIHSQTIASMVHEIYSLNYPNITLSNLDTIVNLIDIKIDTKNDDIANDFKFKLKNLSYGKQGAFADVNMFVEDNFDRVIDILNTIGQISLELEIIITYQNLMNMKEPDSVLCKHLIIDEVQDNSVFEFIFTLRYLEKHKCSLFIVGRSNWEKLPT
jgi:superfamily I DNA or RNA helicase